ncbi:MAG: protein kinase domain-containing protein [Myxococcales bacterium]
MTSVPEPQLPGADPLVGAVLDRYRVLKKLGEGGMGTVYAVEHVMLQKRMAMKLLRADLSRNQDLVTRFQNEAIAASRIGQENIVAVTDFGRTPEGLVYFVMEELQGCSLGDALRAEGRLSLPRALHIAAQVCRALSAAHSAGIVHRDLKPENIVLVPREGMADFVKVLDFGISKMTERPTGERLTQQGMIVGTPEYMSPEQGSGSQVDARSDIYALGVVMFEMLTGRLPFQGDNALQILMRHQTQAPPALSEAAPGVPAVPAIESFVKKALAKRPEDRHQSMAECLADLQVCAGQLRMTMPAIQLPPDLTGLTPTDPIAILAAPSPLRIPSRSPILAPEFSPLPAPAPLRDTVQSQRARGTDELAALALKPRRTGLWIALAAILLGGGAAVLALKGRSPAPEAPLPAPLPAVARPAPQPLPPPPEPVVVPRPPAPAVAQAVPPPRPARAEAAPSPARRPARRPAQAAHAPANKAVPPAADPYQKVDDLKSAY